MTKQQPTQMELHKDTGFIILSAVRYAMGRRTYAVELIIDWVKTFWDKLTFNDKTCIARDVKEFVYSDRSKGDDCDRKDWEAFHLWMQEQLT